MWFIPLFRTLANVALENDYMPKKVVPIVVREAESPLEGMPPVTLILLAFACLLVAAAVAGLTLGLMSLDTTALDIVMQSNNAEQAAAARAIKPIREQGNLLLLTLLLTNTLAAELLPLVLEALVPGGYFSLIVSVLSLLLFGEMIPQAVFSRHPLYFGMRLLGFVKILRFIMYPVAAPIAYILDSLLGEELGTIYNRDELKGLIDVHANNKILTQDETTILKAALEFSLKTVDQIMTPAKDVFKLHIDTQLDRDAMVRILKSGHSRIPLYDESPDDIICLLLVKQLILVNPDDSVPIRALITSRASTHKIRVAPAVECSANTHIPEVLNEFQTGRTHMAFIYDDVRKPQDQRKFLGIVSIEDIIEEILQEEIVDETDIFIDNVSRMPVLVRNADGQLVRAKTLVNNAQSSLNQTPSKSESLHVKEIDVHALRAPLNHKASTTSTTSTMDVAVVVSSGAEEPQYASMSSPDMQGDIAKNEWDNPEAGDSEGRDVAQRSSADNVGVSSKRPNTGNPASSTRSMMSLLGDDDNVLPEDVAHAHRLRMSVRSPKNTEKVKVRPLPLDASSERGEMPERLRRRFSKKVEVGDASVIGKSSSATRYGSIGGSPRQSKSAVSDSGNEDTV